MLHIHSTNNTFVASLRSSPQRRAGAATLTELRSPAVDPGRARRTAHFSSISWNYQIIH